MLKHFVLSVCLGAASLTALPLTASACGEEPVQAARAYIHSAGAFVAQGDGNWAELDQWGQTAFWFQEKERNDQGIFLHDSSRGVTLFIPFQGGQSYWTTSSYGAWWKPLYDVSASNGRHGRRHHGRRGGNEVRWEPPQQDWRAAQGW